ncbi:MAG: hypothetical protein KC502_02940 [Myxococcales bacterium]|nr:hypothetical protein [Myxococcales bacterium]
MKTRSILIGCVVLALSFGCGTEQTNSDGPDTAANSSDTSGDTGAGEADSGGVTGDVASEDSGPADAGPEDVAVDAGAEDTADAAVADSAVADSAVADTNAPDTAQPDTNAPDTAQPDISIDAGPLDKITEHASTCKTDSDCTIPCATGSCSEGKCAYNVGGGCAVDLGGDKVACYPAGAASKAAACLSCKPSISNTALTSITDLVPFESANEGWLISDVSGNGMKWNLSDTRKAGGKMSMYIGDPKSKVYANDKHVKSTATSPVMTVPSNDGVKAALHFWLYLDTEETKGYDYLQVDLIEDKKDAKAEKIFHSDTIGGSTHNVWQMQTLDISKWAGKKVKLIFTFDTLDGYVNAFEGAYIDDLSIRTGCCGGLSDCNDGNACSTDVCAASKDSKGLPVCGHTVKKQCCSSSADCSDGKPCTLDLCSGPGGTCSHNPKPECCMKADDCDDKDSCTIDHCPKAGATCQHTNTCCKADNECVSADPCLVGKCAGGDCAFTSKCCSQDAECDDFNPCTIDACDQGKCIHSPSKAPGCCSVEPVVFEFDSDMDGWKSDPKLSKGLEWHQSTYAGGKTEPENGAGVLRYGIKGQKTFDKLTGSNYLYVTSPVIELPAGQQYTLEIKAKFALNYKTTSNYLYLYYLVDGKQITSYSNYSQKEYYYINHKTDGWVIWQKDVSAFAGKKFQVKLRGRIYGYSSKPQSGQGTLIDYVKIKTSCNAKKCSGNAACVPASTSCQGGVGVCNEGACAFGTGCCKTSADCKSPTLCSIGSCKYGKCSFTEKKNCCMGAGDCDDGNACTVDACPGAGKDCTHTPIPGCCLGSGECDDKKACTQDVCVANKCKHTDVCCKSDSECDDKDSKCTVDKCGSNGFCNFTPTGVVGCCEPNLWSNDFSSSLKSMTLANTDGKDKGWQLWTNATKYKSAKGVLYYGNIASKNYNFGASSGTATTPEITLPAGNPTKLSLWLYQATESGTSYDKSYIYLITSSGKKIQLWYKGSKGFSTNKWNELSFDLKAWAGQKVKIQFLFDTKDSVSNSTLGVLIDDLKFTQKCP